MSDRQTGSVASCPSNLFLNWRLSLVLSGNLWQLFSQRCENIINQIKELYLAFEKTTLL